MIANTIDFLPIGKTRFLGTADGDCRFIQDYQLKDRALWKKFVDVFRSRPDGKDEEWRGEFWGKMMRGACLTYRYTMDAELYGVLEESVRDLLTAQDEMGVFSTYHTEKQYSGWDIWGRKYVLTSLLHFYDICKNVDLKQNVLKAAERHLDVIASDVGEGDGKRSVLTTSDAWGALNSCSILEVVLDAYARIPKPEYLTLAKHLIDCGGSSKGNMIEAALDKNLLPKDYPVKKSYESISYYEGVLEFYRLTGKQKYLDAVLNYVRLLHENENTEIGALGTYKEEWDNSTKNQTVPQPHIGLETCVTVTWIRMLARLYLLTGDKTYIDKIDLSAFNGLRGAINFEKQIFFDEHRLVKDFTSALPFDSYSPVLNGKRGRVVAGYLRFAAGGDYGCCASIGSAGTALFPLLSVVKTTDGYVVNEYFAGGINAEDGFSFTLCGNYPLDKNYTFTVQRSDGKERTISFRIPDWCSSVVIDGTAYTSDQGYAKLTRKWSAGDIVTIALNFGLTSRKQDGLTAYRYGTITLARDTEKENCTDLTAPLTGAGELQRIAPKKGELLRFSLPHDGGTAIFTDYASCGRTWLKLDSRISVWNKIV